MARTLHEPLPTPTRPSSSSYRPPTSLHQQIRPPSASTIPKRAVLGERTDNVFAPGPATQRKVAKSGIPKLVPRVVLAPRLSPGIPRFPRAMRQAAEDQTQLLDMQPPSSVSGLSDTESEAEAPRVRAVLGVGRMMTPTDSQDLPPSSLPIPPSAQPLARLPTPPSSQSDITPKRPTALSRIRPRPSPTPPRREPTLTHPVEPSPNPRQRKNPRVGASVSHDSVIPDRHSSQSSLASSSRAQLEVVLPPRTSQGKKRASLEKTYRERGSSLKTTSRARPSGGSASQPLPRKAPYAHPSSSAPLPSKAKPRKSATRARASLTPRPGHTASIQVGIGEEVEITPGEDPLLLKPKMRTGKQRWISDSEEDDADLALGSGSVRGRGKGKGKARASVEPPRIVKQFPFAPYDPSAPVVEFQDAGELPKRTRRRKPRVSGEDVDPDASQESISTEASLSPSPGPARGEEHEMSFDFGQEGFGSDDEEEGVAGDQGVFGSGLDLAPTLDALFDPIETTARESRMTVASATPAREIRSPTPMASSLHATPTRSPSVVVRRDASASPHAREVASARLVLERLHQHETMKESLLSGQVARQEAVASATPQDTSEGDVTLPDEPDVTESFASAAEETVHTEQATFCVDGVDGDETLLEEPDLDESFITAADVTVRQVREQTALDIVAIEQRDVEADTTMPDEPDLDEICLRPAADVALAAAPTGAWDAVVAPSADAMLHEQPDLDEVNVASGSVTVALVEQGEAVEEAEADATLPEMRDMDELFFDSIAAMDETVEEVYPEEGAEVGQSEHTDDLFAEDETRDCLEDFVHAGEVPAAAAQDEDTAKATAAEACDLPDTPLQTLKAEPRSPAASAPPISLPGVEADVDELAAKKTTASFSAVEAFASLDSATPTEAAPVEGVVLDTECWSEDGEGLEEDQEPEMTQNEAQDDDADKTAEDLTLTLECDDSVELADEYEHFGEEREGHADVTVTYRAPTYAGPEDDAQEPSEATTTPAAALAASPSSVAFTSLPSTPAPPSPGPSRMARLGSFDLHDEAIFGPVLPSSPRGGGTNVRSFAYLASPVKAKEAVLGGTSEEREEPASALVEVDEAGWETLLRKSGFSPAESGQVLVKQEEAGVVEYEVSDYERQPGTEPDTVDAGAVDAPTSQPASTVMEQQSLSCPSRVAAAPASPSSSSSASPLVSPPALPAVATEQHVPTFQEAALSASLSYASDAASADESRDEMVGDASFDAFFGDGDELRERSETPGSPSPQPEGEVAHELEDETATRPVELEAVGILEGEAVEAEQSLVGSEEEAELEEEEEAGDSPGEMADDAASPTAMKPAAEVSETAVITDELLDEAHEDVVAQTDISLGALDQHEVAQTLLVEQGAESEVAVAEEPQEGQEVNAGAEEEEDEQDEEETDEQDEEKEADQSADESLAEAPTPPLPSSKIVLRLQFKGVVKVEPAPEATHLVVESAASEVDAHETESEPACTLAAPAFEAVALALTPPTTALALPSTTPMDSPPVRTEPVQKVVLNEPAELPLTPVSPSKPTHAATAISTTPLGPPPRLAVRGGLTHANRQDTRPLQPSRLSHLITGDTPDASPERLSGAGSPNTPIAAEVGASGAEPSGALAASTSGPGSPSPFVDEGVSMRSTRSLLHEIARAEGKDAERRLKGVVEVSSLDKEAAARAAAILKLNHDYVEHGILSGLDTSTSSSRFAASSLGKSSAQSALAKSVTSYTASADSARALLLAAELELASSAPESMTPAAERTMQTARWAREGTAFSGVTSATGIESPLPLPGAWVRTPREGGKRKRDVSAPGPERAERVVNEDKWGVAEWKRLEQVFKVEKAAWVALREKKALPRVESAETRVHGGLMGWARRASGMGKKASMPPVETVESARPWDAERVVLAFMRDEKDTWDLDVIRVRVQALERRAEEKLAREREKGEIGAEREAEVESPTKKSKTQAQVSTPARARHGGAAVEPPSTIRRVLSWVWGAKGGDAENVEAGSEEPAEGREDAEVFGPVMRGTRPGGRVDATFAPPPPPPPPAPSAHGLLLGRSASAPRARLDKASSKTPSTAFNPDLSFGSASVLGLSTSSSATSSTAAVLTPAHPSSGGTTARLYPSLEPGINERSVLVRGAFSEMHPLFDSHSRSGGSGGDTSFGSSSTASAGGVGKDKDKGKGRDRDREFGVGPGLKRQGSVKDLVRVFELSGSLGGLARGGGGGGARR